MIFQILKCLLANSIGLLSVSDIVQTFRLRLDTAVFEEEQLFGGFEVG